MEPLALYVRLLLATVAAIASSLFVAAYTSISMDVVRVRLGLRSFETFPQVTQFLARCGLYSLIVPVCFVVLGVCVIHRWKNKAAFEFAVGGQWLFAFLWLLYGLFACLAPEILTNKY